MIIALTGANGFIGTEIRERFKNVASDILILKRNAPDDIWRGILSRADVIINLAGSPVLKRWSRKNRKLILESRVVTTRRIVAILNGIPKNLPPKLLISASATGIYPNDDFKQFDEYTPLAEGGFLAMVVSKWEAEANKLINPSVRLVIVRLGVVLSYNGGMLKFMLPIFRLCLGGIIGSGKQTTSFIHIDDLLDAILFFIKNEETTGLYNLVTPNPLTNKRFTKIIAENLHRPALFRIPAFILNVLYGKASCIMLNGAPVYPRRLINQGFLFKYPTFEEAIDNLLN